MEVLKPQNRSVDEIIRYLLDVKKQGIEESMTFSNTKGFQVVRKKLKELNKKMLYNFYFEGGQNNSYLFETKGELIYEIIFKPIPYLFDVQHIEII